MERGLSTADLALIYLSNKEWAKGYKQGLLRAAREVETHWNSSDTQVNQKEQAERSAKVITQFGTECLNSNGDREI